MTPVNPFILKNKEKMVDFLDELSVSLILIPFVNCHEQINTDVYLKVAN